MNWLLNSSFAHDIGMTLVHSLWQIALVAAAFAIANRLLARRSASLRYLVAYAGLCFMLALPLVTLFVIRADSKRSEARVAEAARQFEESVAPDAASATGIAYPDSDVAMLPIEPMQEAQIAIPEVAAEGVLVVEPQTTREWSWILPWLSVAWSLGVMASSLRPLLALHGCRRTRKQARPIEQPWMKDTLESLCARIGLQRKVEIASSTLVHVPTVIGFLRPIILLPLAMVSGQTPHELSAIIAHELAHIRRHDFLLNLFQTAIETLLFYHPAAWWLSAIVRQERENCCDDIAMAICGRKNYATALANLEFARSSQTSLALTADGGSLYRRIHRIVRPHETPNPLGRWLAALVALTALLLGVVAVLPTDAVVIAADDQPKPESVAAESEKQADDTSAKTGKDNQARPANATRTYSGKVLDVDGRPVAGVKVYAENTIYDRHLDGWVSRELQSTLSAADGSYRLNFKPQNGMNHVIAAKNGYGPAIAGFDVLHKLFQQGRSALDLRLVNAMAIAGRVVDTEGNPLAGITVHVDQVALPKSEEAVAEWIANERPELFTNRDRSSVMMSHDARVMSTVFPKAAAVRHGAAIPGDVTTAADGRFRLDGLGENCRVQLTLSGPNIAQRKALVVTRQMKSVMAFAYEVPGLFTHYGASPTLVASPTQPIVGRVVDAETQQPLPNMPVHLARSGNDVMMRGVDEIADVTDADGRFRLVGAPLGGQHRIEVHPPLDEPYFETERELPVASGSAPLECDFELPRAKWIRGRVTDEAGSPIVATVEFYPFRNNPHAESFTKFDPRIGGSVPDDKFDSDENGYFRIKAIPGPAVLAAVAKERDERLKYMPNRDEDLLTRIGGQSMSKVYNSWSADYFDAMVEVNLPSDQDELTQDLMFKLGGTRTLNITDDDGQPVSKVQAIGPTFPPQYRDKSLQNSSMEVVGLRPTESRMVALVHEQREIGTVLKVGGDESDPINVRLLPCATVTGRIVDEDGVGIQNVSIQVALVQEPKTDTWSRRLNQVTTDADGRFRVLLPPGGACRIFAYSDVGPNISATIRPEPGVTYALGDLKHEDELDESDTTRLVPSTAASTSAGTEAIASAGAEAAQGKAVASVPNEPTPNRNLDPVVTRVKADAGDGKATRSSNDQRSYAGQVLLPNGMPAANADIYLVHWLPTPLKKMPAKTLAKTDREGRFRFTLERDAHGEAPSGMIVAKLDGYAFAWASGPALLESDDLARRLADPPPTYRDTLERDRGPMRLLVDDAPITGRVVDTEGNGVSGVSVYVAEVLGGPDNTMAAWDRVTSGTGPDYMKLQSALTRTLRGPSVPTLLGETKTDDDGRFTIRGLGKHRIARIVMQGAGIVAESVYARTSGGPSILLPMEASQRLDGFGFTYHGNDFTLVAERSRPVVGQVTNEQGNGIAGVVVTSRRSYSQRFDGGQVKTSRSGSDDVIAITDAEGNYRLDGLPTSHGNMLRLSSPAGSSYLAATETVDTQSANESGQRNAPITKDFELKNGLVVEGRVTDAANGDGVAGHFRFVRPTKNDLVFTAVIVGSQIQRSQADGTFRIIVPKTAGTLSFTAFARHKYRMSQLHRNTKGSAANHVKVVDGDVTMVGTRALTQGHAIYPIKGIETGPLRLALNVTRASVVPGHAVGPDGQRLSRIYYTGQSNQRAYWARSANGVLDIYDFDKQQPRRVAAIQRAEKLAGIRTLKAVEGDFRVRLRPWSTVRGRIVDTEGEPLAGVRIDSGTGGPAFQPVASPAGAMTVRAERKQPLALPPNDEAGNSRYTTDENGRFEIAGLVAGETYHLDGRHNTMSPLNVLINTFVRDLVLKPGELRDLGDVVLKKTESPKRAQRSNVFNKPNADSGAEPKRSARPHSIYTGFIQNQDGSAAAGAHVAVIARQLDGQLWRDSVSLAEATADATGRFKIQLQGVSEKTHANPHVVMRSEDSGIAWKRLDKQQLNATETDLGVTTLQPQQLIRCRLVDLEGRPAAHLEVTLDGIVVPAQEEDRSEWLRFSKLQQPPKAWLQRLRTDENGLLTIPSIASGQGVYLLVLATDEFAPQHIALNTGMAEQRGERDGTYRSIVKNMGKEVATIPLSPAKTFEGVVRLADTGQPAANVRISIWARQENSGSMVSLFDKTDDQGRFRLNPYPGVRFGITAYPPEGTAYQIKRLGGFEGLRWTSGDASKNVTIELNRGVLATGRIVDEKSGEPIADAAVQYQPMQTNPNNADDIITGWQGIKKTNNRGEFRISVLPGEGWLLVHSNSRDHVLQERTSRRLALDKPGGVRHYAHAFMKINPTKGEANVGQIKLTPARSVTLEVVDPDGQPIAEGIAVSRLHVSAYSGRWRGQNPDVIRDGRVEIGGLGKGVDYPIYLLDPKRKLGAVATVNAQQSTQRITLQPCGTAVKRYVSPQGDPLAGKGLPFHMVVTPGVNYFDMDAMTYKGKVAADEDFVANIDRLNHWNNLSRDDGRLVLAALIPGATYRYAAGEMKMKQLIAKSGETIEIGQQTIADDEE